MIIYWETLEKNAGDVSPIPDYISSGYFGGVTRVKACTAYPTGLPYGAICYRTDYKKFYGFHEDLGWVQL
jgi:hypothetical protein